MFGVVCVERFLCGSGMISTSTCARFGQRPWIETNKWIFVRILPKYTNNGWVSPAELLIKIERPKWIELASGGHEHWAHKPNQYSDSNPVFEMRARARANCTYYHLTDKHDLRLRSIFGIVNSNIHTHCSVLMLIALVTVRLLSFDELNFFPFHSVVRPLLSCGDVCSKYRIRWWQNFEFAKFNSEWKTELTTAIHHRLLVISVICALMMPQYG